MLIFDCFIAEHFGVDIIKQWQNDPYKWTFPVLISQSLVTEFADDTDSPFSPHFI